MQLSVAVPPGPRSVEYAQLAQELGYQRFWLYDSAALYDDIWIWLARIAEHTDIDIGTAVLVPNLRHVMTTASAIATIEGLAPGRLACGFGTGATARWVLNKKALSWATTRRYLEQLRGLLRGEVVEIDGERCQMIHHPDLAAARPLATPLLVSALGPKGKEVVRQLYAADVIDGFIEMDDAADVDIPCRVRMTVSTVLEPGETLASERVQEALGPWYVVQYHGVWQTFPDAVVHMPSGAEWLAGINDERPDGERHLAVHEGHITTVMPRDRDILAVAGDALATTGWVGTADKIRARAVAAEASGVTDLMYTPAGDIPREMRAFAEAVRG